MLKNSLTKLLSTLVPALVNLLQLPNPVFCIFFPFPVSVKLTFDFDGLLIKLQCLVVSVQIFIQDTCRPEPCRMRSVRIPLKSPFEIQKRYRVILEIFMDYTRSICRIIDLVTGRMFS